jgi:hypothetical protein
LSCTVFVLSGRGLCDGPIPRPEESYRLWCVSECEQVKIKTLDTCCEQVGSGGKDCETKLVKCNIFGTIFNTQNMQETGLCLNSSYIIIEFCIKPSRDPASDPPRFSFGSRPEVGNDWSTSWAPSLFVAKGHVCSVGCFAGRTWKNNEWRT